MERIIITWATEFVEHHLRPCWTLSVVKKKTSAALRKSNMTHEPIVMWLGNSSSPPRLIPWSSVNKSPGGPPKSSVAGSPEKLAKPLRHTGEQAMTSLASRISTPAVSLRSQSAHPHGKKNGMSVKKRKGSDAHGARKKKKKGGKKKPKKGLKKQHGVKGHSKQKGRKKAKGSKKPPNKMKKQTTRKLPTKHSTH
ncbi:hypothetical protein HPB50_018129 [Hyalomma asiaticum]|uniref:Uncharacterized protein n=1 Tax=Hyalomma asiaticum TaxID=266040 RepID=A0ACB7T3J8_HYAAI|nr:hypothetical protein HPB50_018129 [Hyalomma asiaticum]